jgi:hypothetical protein
MSETNEINSNAFNFTDFLQSGVDPRTLSFSVQIKIGEFVSRLGRGESLPINVGYSSFNNQDQGFGRGWSFAISFFNKNTSYLSLMTGQSFKIEWDDTLGEYKIPYRKLKDIRVFYVDKTNELKVVFKDGHEEYLNYELGTLEKIVSADGLAYFFEYGDFYDKRTLWKISDNFNTTLEFDWWSHEFKTIVEYKVQGKLKRKITFEKHGSDYELKRVYIEGFSSPIEFDYIIFHQSQQKCIRSMTSSTGMIEEIEYLNTLYLPKGAPIAVLPAVAKHTTYLGEQQENRVIEYKILYGNYFGFGSDRNWIPGEDNLFFANVDYKYKTKEVINNKKEVIRTYNKYHLLESEVYYFKSEIVKKNETIYYARLDQPIENQPAQYYLDKEQITTYYYKGKSRESRVKREFDEYGNIIKLTQNDGTNIEFFYYPAEGDGSSCPKNPTGIVAFIKKEILTTDSNHAAPRYNEYKYKKIAGSDKIVIIEKKEYTGIKIEYKYNENTHNEYSYGKVKYEKITDISKNKEISEKTQQYVDEGEHLVISSKLTSFDGLILNKIEHLSYLHNQKIKDIDEKGHVTNYEYDNLSRLVKETLHPQEPEYSVSKSYQYIITYTDFINIEIDKLGNTQKTFFNASGNITKLSLKTKTQTQEYQLGAFFYDAYGNKTKEVNYDYHNGLEIIKSETLYEYDAYDQVAKITNFFGITENIVRDLVDLTVKRVVSDLYINTMKFNQHGFEIESKVEDFNGDIFKYNKSEVDFFGNIIKEIDMLGRETYNYFDIYDRIIKTEKETKSGKLSVEYQYMPFTSEDFVQKVIVNGDLIAKREFDGLMRVKWEEKAGIKTSYEYFGTTELMSKIIKASGDEVIIEHDKYLLLPNYYILPKFPHLSRTFSYNKKTSAISFIENEIARIDYKYDDLMRVAQTDIILKKQSNVIKSVKNTYTVASLVIESSDFENHLTTFSYEKKTGNLIGKKISLNAGDENEINVTISYDELNRENEYLTEYNGKNEKLEIKYNILDNEIQREFSQNNNKVMLIEQDYDKLQKIKLKRTTLYQENDRMIFAEESYFYDELDQLIEHKIENYTESDDIYPVDEYNKKFSKQKFSYDFFGNVKTVETDFIDGAKNKQIYLYDRRHVVRLAETQNTYSDYPPRILFYYDANGNLANDYLDRWYRYNPFDQLEQVVNRNHQSLSLYQYLPNGELLSQIYENNTENMFYLDKTIACISLNGKTDSYLKHASGLLMNISKDEQNKAAVSHLLGDFSGSIRTQFFAAQDEQLASPLRIYSSYGVKTELKTSSTLINKKRLF